MCNPKLGIDSPCPVACSSFLFQHQCSRSMVLKLGRCSSICFMCFGQWNKIETEGWNPAPFFLQQEESLKKIEAFIAFTRKPLNSFKAILQNVLESFFFWMPKKDSPKTLRGSRQWDSLGSGCNFPWHNSWCNLEKQLIKLGQGVFLALGLQNESFLSRYYLRRCVVQLLIIQLPLDFQLRMVS